MAIRMIMIYSRRAELRGMGDAAENIGHVQKCPEFMLDHTGSAGCG